MIGRIHAKIDEDLRRGITTRISFFQLFFLLAQPVDHLRFLKKRLTLILWFLGLKIIGG